MNFDANGPMAYIPYVQPTVQQLHELYELWYLVNFCAAWGGHHGLYVSKDTFGTGHKILQRAMPFRGKNQTMTWSGSGEDRTKFCTVLGNMFMIRKNEPFTSF